MKIVYIAGPMRGLPRCNFDAFDEAAASLRARGLSVFSPADRDREHGFNPDTDAGLVTGEFLADAMMDDLATIVSSDAVVVLPGWERSEGARIEVAFARMIRRPVLDLDTLQPIQRPIPETVLQEAARITSGDRDGDYGHPVDHWGRTAGAINEMFATDMAAADWGLVMILDKVARFRHKPKRDTLVDICGYARCVERVLARQGVEGMQP